MARQPSDINPDDTYLPSNLGPGDPWARQVVNDLIALKKEAFARRQSENGANRGDAASRAALAEQLNSVVKTVPASNYVGPFSVTTTSLPVVSVDLVVPVGYSQVDIISQGYALVFNTADPRGYVYATLSVNGTPGYDFLGYEIGSGASNSLAYSPLGDTRTIAVTAGSTITVAVNIRKSGTGVFNSHASNRAHLNLIAVYHN